MSGLEEHHARRIERVREGLSERGLQALWIEPSVGLYYLTGLEPVSMERLFGLLVPASGDLKMVVPMLLRDECTHLMEIEQFVWDDGQGPEEATRTALKGISHLHVEGSLSFWMLQTLRAARPDLVIDEDPEILSGLRERKDEWEVELIRRSGRVTDEMVEWVGSLDLEALTERRLAGRIQARYLELGFTPSSHGLISAGRNAAMPHYVAGDVRIDRSQLLLMDFGCAIEGYWSDITRIYFPRDVHPEISEAYDIVCDAYDAAFDVVEPGVRCHDVDRAAREVIEKGGYGEAFLHRTGHGLGLEVHEPPYLRAGNDQRLETGHVFSIEPGIYVPGRFGVRYENIVHLGPDGPESMNGSPRHHYFG